MIKKRYTILILLLIMIMAFSIVLVACNDDTTTPSNPDSGNNQTPPDTDDDMPLKTLAEKYDVFLTQMNSTVYQLYFEIEMTEQNMSYSLYKSIDEKGTFYSGGASSNGIRFDQQVYYQFYDNNYVYRINYYMDNVDVVDYNIEYAKLEKSNLNKDINEFILQEVLQLDYDLWQCIDEDAQFGDTQATFSNDEVKNGVLTIDNDGKLVFEFDFYYQSTDCNVKIQLDKIDTNVVQLEDKFNDIYKKVTDKEYHFASINYANLSKYGRLQVEYKNQQGIILSTRTAIVNNGDMCMTDSASNRITAYIKQAEGFYTMVESYSGYINITNVYKYDMRMEDIINLSLHNFIDRDNYSIEDNFEFDPVSKKYTATENALNNYYDLCKSVTIDISVDGQYVIEVEAMDQIYGAKYIKATVSDIDENLDLNIPQEMLKYECVDNMLYEIINDNSVRLVGIIPDEFVANVPNSVTFNGKSYTVTEIFLQAEIQKVYRTLNIPSSVEKILINQILYAFERITFESYGVWSVGVETVTVEVGFEYSEEFQNFSSIIWTKNNDKPSA